VAERDATRHSYDDLAADYAANLGSELDGKPFDRALLDAFAEVASGGVIADLGAGPGHIAGYLKARGAAVIASDLSPQMCAIGSRRESLPFFASDMCALPLASGSLGGIVCLYAVIHLDDESRVRAYREFARVLREGGQALISFHTDDVETSRGEARQTTELMGHDVELTFRFLDPERELQLLADAGLEYVARLDRAPHPGAEHASQRSYLLTYRRFGT
jgi:SAM-dependent methyltransferase